MIDIRGELVGINTAILSHGGRRQSGHRLRHSHQSWPPSWIRLSTTEKSCAATSASIIQELTPEIAKAFDFNQSGGVLIGDVSPDGPSAKAGLKKGDMIVKLDGAPETDPNTLRNRIAAMAPGTNVKLQIWRDGKAQDYSMTLGELPPDKGEAEGPADNSTNSGGLEGVSVQALTADVAQQLNLNPNTKGVVVSSVDEASPAASAGLSRGDVIQEVNHKPVTSVSDYRQAVASAGNQPVLLLVNHGGITAYIVVEAH